MIYATIKFKYYDLSNIDENDLFVSFFMHGTYLCT